MATKITIYLLRNSQLRIVTRSRAALVQFTNTFTGLLQKEFTSSKVFGDLLKSTIALFVVFNPIGTIPLFIGITQNMKRKKRKAVSKP
jgi:MarC family integral membrane protein